MAAEFGLSATSTRAGASGSTVAATAGERHRNTSFSAASRSPATAISRAKIAPVRGDIKMTASMPPEARSSRVGGRKRRRRHGPIGDDFAQLYALRLQGGLEVEGDVLAAHVRQRSVQGARGVGDDGHQVGRRAASLDDARKSELAGERAVPGPTAMIGSCRAAAIAALSARARSPLRLVTTRPAASPSASAAIGRCSMRQQRLGRHLMAERFEPRAERVGVGLWAGNEQMHQAVA